MKKIGFFGGCFNPPTNIHIELANNLIKQAKLDEVIFVPVNDYYKKDNLVPATDRLRMLSLALKDFENLSVDDIELKENRKLYASDIFELIKEKYLGNKLYMIMGSDNFNKMPKWKNYDSIKDLYNYIVIDRNENDISSTKIRQMIKESNRNVKEYLHEDVYKYILENNLYKEDLNG